MDNIDKYIKATKEVIVKPEKESIENKILDRIRDLKDDDKNLIDEKFLDFLKKSNSRLYLFTEKILNNPGKFILAIISIAAIAGVSAVLIRDFLREPDGK
jgi:hypothetical protein